MTAFTGGEWLVLIQHELLLFAGVFFLIGAIDEISVDLVWLWLKLSGRSPTKILAPAQEVPQPLGGLAAVFIPTWQEAAVIGATIRHALQAWPHDQLRLYVGCYANDADTMSEIAASAGGDTRLRLVVLGKHGPTTKADCLNRLYHALQIDERRAGHQARLVILHDAEDMVDPAALNQLDRAMDTAELVQLPVVPEPQQESPWVGSHYCEEFAEAHGKMMVVRQALGAGMPLAGVGCAVSRGMLTKLEDISGNSRPFADGCLTEDYELGLAVSELGGRAQFIRVRHGDGRLVATRAFFPARLDQSVRQKTRWVQGIALQGWDRLGWTGRPTETWMRLRDRRGPFTALVLAVAYVLLIMSAAIWAVGAFWGGPSLALTAALRTILAVNLVSFVWRALWRFAFTAREYGFRQGCMALLRIPVANIIAIMAGRRALIAYIRTLAGQALHWDKTDHAAHPVILLKARGRA